MRRRAPLIVLAVLAVLAGGRALRAELGGGASTVVYPTQQLPVSFSHQKHLERGETCESCHASATGSTRASDQLMPGEAACAACHDIDRQDPTRVPAAGKAAGACSLCHPGWKGAGQPPPVIAPAPHLKFSHKLHAGRGVACTTCHGDLAAQRVGLATRAQLPRMASCLGCHDGETASARCAACHPASASGELQTSFAEGQLVPAGTLRADAHDVRFATDHASAGQDQAYCENCHARAFCVECHDGQQKPMGFHAGDYTRVHAVEARRNDPDCGSCHRVQSFCTGCHARVGMTTDQKTSEFAGDRVADRAAPRWHGARWSDDGAAGSTAHHGVQAQRNLVACASCHREDFCQGCHTAEPGARMQVSPHGNAWAGSTRCRTLEDKNPRLCLRCHVEGRTCDE
jgi:hypothetical protein